MLIDYIIFNLFISESAKILIKTFELYNQQIINSCNCALLTNLEFNE